MSDEARYTRKQVVVAMNNAINDIIEGVRKSSYAPIPDNVITALGLLVNVTDYYLSYGLDLVGAITEHYGEDVGTLEIFRGIVYAPGTDPLTSDPGRRGY